MEYKGFTYTPAPKTAWDSLSMQEKSEMMKVAVRNGITDLKTIREKYNEFAMGGDKRERMPAHPRNREKDPESYDAAQQWRAERQQRKQQQEEQNRAYVEEKAERNARAAEELNKHKDTVMSALSDIADSVPFTGSAMKEAAETQRQEKLDKWHDIQKGVDATMTAAELAAAGYGVVRGLTHFNRMLAKQATQSTGQAVSREAMQNLLKWNNRVATIDKPQVLMNGIGSTADAYQWATANNSFDAWENGLETGANTAGVVGGMNWFRDLPILQRIGGNRIDAVLDGLGYGAAAWDVVKNLPPLSGTLEDIKQQSEEQKAYGGSIHIKPENRGKFTALKKRTGHSATWFKEHGTPAQKKMATFALNARKWKHGLGGNLFDGISEDTQQMQIGRPFWQSQTQEPSLAESLTEFNRQQELKKQQQRQALREKINTVGKKLAEERMREDSVESNDNAWIDTPLTYKKKNPHLSRRAEEGAKAHATWEKEHPNLTAWGNLVGAAPFAVASVPLGAGIVAGGDALTATTAGQAVTSGLAPLYQAATGASIAGAPILAWADAGLTSAFGAHGLQQAAEDGGISPMTALEIAPLYWPFTMVGKTGVTKVAPVVESFVENHPALYQYPRYIKGKFKYGFDAELPTLYRKMEPGVIPAIDGKGIMSFTNNPSRFRYTATGEDPLITNFTTDVPVRSHSSHWEPDDVFAFSGKSLLGHKVVSTRPSDTFTVGKEVRVPAKKVTFVSGRPDAVEKAQKLGYNIYIDDILKDEAAFAKDSWDAVKGKSFNFSKEWDKYIDYDKAIQNTTRNLFRKPTLRDYKFMDYVFRPRYSSQVEPLSNKNVYFDLQNENIWPEWWKGAISNANTRFLMEDLDNLLYHPATPAEARYRDMMGIELLKDIPNNIRSTWKK